MTYATVVGKLAILANKRQDIKMNHLLVSHSCNAGNRAKDKRAKVQEWSGKGDKDVNKDKVGISNMGKGGLKFEGK